MSVEGLWSIYFESNVEILPGMKGMGGGVVVFETSKIFGGDTHYFYLGQYEVLGNEMKAKVDVNKYDPNGIDIFFLGEDKYKLEISGTLGSTEIGSVCEGVGHVLGYPDRKIKLILTKRAELP